MSTIVLKKLQLYLVILPRPFALPACICGIALGLVLAKTAMVPAVLALLSGAFLMAFAHSMNTFLDYSWTHLDKGGEEERSKPKPYTTGQQPIAAGQLTEAQVLIASVGWLALSAMPLLLLPRTALIPWLLVIGITFLYSWGKLHYLCEIALGLGFGTFAVWLGMAAAGQPNWMLGFLASLPFVLLWGFTAEFVDQATDAEVNYPKGLRNLGALAYKNNISVPLFTAWLWSFSYLVQSVLIVGGVLTPLSGLSLVAFPLIAYGLLAMGEKFSKGGVLILLIAVFIHMIFLVAGQALG